MSSPVRVARYGPEAEVLVACARRCCGAAAGEEVRERAWRDPDWARLLAFAQLHGVMPILRAGLEGIDVPATADACIRTEFQRSAAASLLFARELVRLSDSFRRTGLPFLALKGPALAARAFGKITVRQCRDLDLLVAPEDLGRAFGVLRSAGYQEVPIVAGYQEVPIVGRRQPPAPRNNQKHLCLVREDTGMHVELHWAVSNPSFSFGLPFEGLWERREPVSVLGAQVDAPHSEDLLLTLSAHGASHCWTSLKWVCDIAALVRRCPEIDWARLVKRASKAGGRRMLLLALALARDAAGADLPAAIEREVEDDAAVARLGRETCARIFAAADRLENEHRVLVQIRSRERLRDRARMAVAYVRPKLRPTGRERALIPLPGFARFLYWPLRLARLAAVYPLEIAKPLLSGLAGWR